MFVPSRSISAINPACEEDNPRTPTIAAVPIAIQFHAYLGPAALHFDVIEFPQAEQIAIHLERNSALQVTGRDHACTPCVGSLSAAISQEHHHH
jgi:hypothetical protein